MGEGLVRRYQEVVSHSEGMSYAEWRGSGLDETAGQVSLLVVRSPAPQLCYGPIAWMASTDR